MAVKRVCVFCGSSPGSRPEYVEAAGALGRALVNNGIGLVYGGAKVGMMGAVASAVMEGKGKAIGVIPEAIEEFFEVVTWAQLGIHKKPCGLLNTCGYYDKAIGFLDHAVNEQFIAPASRSLVLVEEDPDTLLKKFSDYRQPKIDKAAWALELANKKVKT